MHAAAALRQDLHFPRHRLAVKRQEDEFLAVAIANRGSGHKNTLRLRGRGLGFVRQELDGGVHVGPQIGIGIQDLHFHLHRGLGPVGLGRNLRDHAILLAVRIGIHR